MFKEESYCDQFLTKFNSLHQSLNFSHEKETDRKLPSSDVLVEKSDTQFLTLVYRKPTFTGQYIDWDSFGPKSRKTNLLALSFTKL